MKIQDLEARKILNSNGNWTIECQLKTNRGSITASVPAGISLGESEKAPVGVEIAIKQIENPILSRVKDVELDQKSLDKILTDGGWGSNATLAVSAGFFKLETKNLVCNHNPKLMMLMFEGKKHGNHNLKIQEFMLICDNVTQGVGVFHRLKKKLEEKNMMTTVGVEGGFSPPDIDEESILKLLSSFNLPIALDVAGNTKPYDLDDMVNLVKNYPIKSVEDPFSENKPHLWKKFYDIFNGDKKLLIVGDDLTVTDKDKISTAAEDKLINAVIIKPNQQGTITAGFQAVDTAKKLGLKTIASHRGESTNDDWIADFALKAEVDFVKFGAPNRGERIAKYNRLL
jgi:enolase